MGRMLGGGRGRRSRRWRRWRRPKAGQLRAHEGLRRPGDPRQVRQGRRDQGRPAGRATCSSSTPAPRPAPPTSCRWPRTSSRGRGVGRSGRSSAARTCSRTSRFRQGQGRQGHAPAGLRLLPALAHRSEHHRPLPVDPRPTTSGRAHGACASRSRTCDRVVKQAKQLGGQRRHGRSLARRVDHDRLRDLGLPRQAGRERAARPGVHRRRQQPGAGDPDAARASLQTLSTSSPWLASVASPAPLAGLFEASGALSVLMAPNEPSLGWAWPALPANLKPPVPPTNEAPVRVRARRETSPPPWIATRRTSGGWRTAATPRPWVRAGELTPIRRYATMISGWGLRSARRHRLVSPAAPDDRLRRRRRWQPEAGAGRAGRQAIHGNDLSKRLRIYAFGAALGGQRMLDAASILAEQSGIPKSAARAGRPGTRRTRTTTRTRRAPRTTRQEPDPVPQEGRREALGLRAGRGL